MARRTHKRQPHPYDVCRSIGHAWFLTDATWTPSFGTPWEMRCERCNAIRREIIDIHGEVAQRKYLYPDGYRMSEKLPRSAFRVRVIGE